MLTPESCARRGRPRRSSGTRVRGGDTSAARGPGRACNSIIPPSAVRSSTPRRTPARGDVWRGAVRVYSLTGVAGVLRAVALGRSLPIPTFPMSIAAETLGGAGSASIPMGRTTCKGIVWHAAELRRHAHLRRWWDRVPTFERAILPAPGVAIIRRGPLPGRQDSSFIPQRSTSGCFVAIPSKTRFGHIRRPIDRRAPDHVFDASVCRTEAFNSAACPTQSSPADERFLKSGRGMTGDLAQSLPVDVFPDAFRFVRRGRRPVKPGQC